MLLFVKNLLLPKKIHYSLISALTRDLIFLTYLAFKDGIPTLVYIPYHHLKQNICLQFLYDLIQIVVELYRSTLYHLY